MIPKSVQVGPFRFRIETDDVAKITLTDAHGETDIERLVIRLHPDRNTMIIRETLLHETLHACASVAGLDHELGAELEEKVVRRLATILLDVMIRNGKLVDYLCGTTATEEVTPKAKATRSRGKASRKPSAT